VRFGRDPDKAASNLRKHGIAFEDAARVFLDPLAVHEQDRIVDGEERWQTIGTLNHTLIVVVAHTTHGDGDDEFIRIISARKAERHERRRYESS
tara:strand:+ start:1052 stop:1333 length:282 start_codon:yes stop_codon:yes gene_type:complete